jgi:hypothetical protein
MISEKKLRYSIRSELRALLIESKLRSNRKNLEEKKWSDFEAKTGTSVDLKPEDFAENDPEVRDLDDQIFDLIQNAYAEVELEPGVYGNAKIKKPEDLPGGYTVMQAIELDGDDEPDYFRGGKMRGDRYKLGIVGHDGSAAAIQKYLEVSAEKLKSGDIAEMSGKIAHIMITRYNVPSVSTKEEVEQFLGKTVEWVGNHPDEKYADRYGPNHAGWYTRSIGGSAHLKILLGGV